MILKIVKYIYNFGIKDFLQRCIDRNYRPRGMGIGVIMRCGVLRVGTLWTIPTLKSWRVWKLLRNANRLDVVLTLMWGGGSAAYVEGKIAKKSDGDFTLVVFPTYRTGMLWVELWNGRTRVEKFPIASLSALNSLRGKCNKLIINHIVQWNSFLHDGDYKLNDYETIVKAVMRLKVRLSASMVFMVHDYFSVCPRFTLTDSNDKYCASEFSCIQCAKCLATNEKTALKFVPGIAITEWRKIFGALLNACDEVRTFSKDTLDRMQKIYPAANLTVVPHAPLNMYEHLSGLQKDKLVIGVFGCLLPIKGARHVVAMAKYLDQIGDRSTRIVVVGTLVLPDEYSQASRITVTGKYKSADLPRLVLTNEINLAWFPSVCPETFSYVVQELMQLQLPIVCYNIGAPKDRMPEYVHGMIAPEITVESAWETISQLANKIGICSHA